MIRSLNSLVEQIVFEVWGSNVYLTLIWFYFKYLVFHNSISSRTYKLWGKDPLLVQNINEKIYEHTWTILLLIFDNTHNGYYISIYVQTELLDSHSHTSEVCVNCDGDTVLGWSQHVECILCSSHDLHQGCFGFASFACNIGH